MTVTLDQAWKLLQELSDETYKAPTTIHMRNGQFQLQSYSHWAIEELKLYLLYDNSESPLTSVEQFMYLMSDLGARATTPNANLMYLTARDVAYDVWDILRIMGSYT